MDNTNIKVGSLLTRDVHWRGDYLWLVIKKDYFGYHILNLNSKTKTVVSNPVFSGFRLIV